MSQASYYFSREMAQVAQFETTQWVIVAVVLVGVGVFCMRGLGDVRM